MRARPIGFIFGSIFAAFSMVFMVNCGGVTSNRSEPGVESCLTSNCHGGIENIHPLFQLSCVDCHGGNNQALNKEDSHVARPPNFGEFPLQAGTHVNNDKFLRGPRAVREDDVNPLNADHSDPALLAFRRFLNPGALYVANQSCGTEFPNEAGRCHGEIYQRVTRSLHATSAGLVSGVYYVNGFRNKFTTVAGDDTDKDAFACAVLQNGGPIVDPNFDPSIVGTVAQISKEVPRDIFENRNLNPPANIPVNGDFMFMMTTSFVHNDCTRCHLYSEGAKRPGEFRSAGCSACHVYYTNEGRSVTADRSINKNETDHPYRHEMQRFPPDEQCIHCHNRGGRHGSEFKGIRERPQGFKDQMFNDHGENNRVNDSAVAGGRTGGFFPAVPRFLLSRTAANALANPEAVGDFYVGREYVEFDLWKRETGRTDGNNYLILQEDRTNTVDETPEDIHSRRGMQCVDCHTRAELHGDGHIYSDRFREHEIECESCHGTPLEKAKLVTRRGRRVLEAPPSAMRGVFMDGNGDVFQTFAPIQGRVDPKLIHNPIVRRIVQVKDVVTPGHPDFAPGAIDGCLLHSSGPSSTNPTSPGSNNPLETSPNRMECFTCHAVWANNCLSCHMILDYGAAANGDTNGDGILEVRKDFGSSYLDNNTRIGLQRQQRFLTVPDHLTLGINYEGRISPHQIGGQAAIFAISPAGGRGVDDKGPWVSTNFVADPGFPAITANQNMTNFVFSVNDRGKFLIAMPINQNFPHTTQEYPRNCDACHPNPALTGPERGAQLGVVDKAVGIGNGLRIAGGVSNSPNRISTARVYDDPINGTGTVVVSPFQSGSESGMVFRFRDIKIRRENMRLFTRNRNKADGSIDFIDFATGLAASNGDIIDINLDEFINLTPNPTTLDNTALGTYTVATIQQQRPTTHRQAGPLDAVAIQKMYRNLVAPQARNSDSQANR
jgi:hypothetical protein